jgi:hypothetical protein
VPVCRCAGVPVCRCAGVPVCRCAGVPVCRCAGVPGVPFRLEEPNHRPAVLATPFH